MRLFRSKPKATASVKNELNKELDHLRTVQKILNSTDSISTYYSNFEEMVMTYTRIQEMGLSYNWKSGPYKWDDGVVKALQEVVKTRREVEKAFVDRAYEKLQRECLELSTDKAKENKRKKFFEELEDYNGYFTGSTLTYIDSLKQ